METVVKKFDRLYKKTSTGAIQFWDIKVQEKESKWANNEPLLAGEITTVYGQLGTDSPQTTKEVIALGKNIGKANETTAYEQALAEAQAKHEKQRKKGYVDSIEAAQAGELDELIEGGINVMLAKSYAKDGHKIKYPAYISPKLDGLRCVAMVKGGVCTLWSRTRKPITSMPEIVKALTGLPYDAVFDGEIYSDTHSNNFEEIVSLVRQESPDKNSNKMQYHVFDLVNAGPYKERLGDLKTMVKNIDSPYILAVESNLVENEEQALDYFQEFIDQKFEGAMIRNKDSLYVGKRSADLQKIKEFDDAEFEIIGVSEGRGKLAGHTGAFVCRTEDGAEFRAKMSGDTERLRSYFLDMSLWKGRYLTVQYQGLTSYGIPRFPVGKAIRDYE
jgi:DNA ligase-1